MNRLNGAEWPLRWRCCLIGLVALAAATVAWTADDETLDAGILAETGRPDVEQQTGFVVDRTITNFGGEFFRFFSEAWRDQSGAADVDLTVVERPSARFGSMVYVEHNNRQIVRVFLYAGRSAAIKPSAVAAARYVAGQVAENALAGLLMNDPDLGEDDLK